MSSDSSDLARIDDLDIGWISGSTVILDIDGTITSDAGSDISDGVMKAVRALAHQNTIYLCSNHRDISRNKRIAQCAGLQCIATKHRKPSRKIIDAIPPICRDRPTVVIGDKLTVDGLFAWRIGARFIKVGRIVSPGDRQLVRIGYFFDNLLSRVAACLLPGCLLRFH